MAYSACKNETVLVSVKDHVATIMLNRADKRNAFDKDMIDELVTAFKCANSDKATRIVVLRGKGKHFCAGADLEWMQASQDASTRANQQDAMKLAELMEAVYHCEKPVIALVQGNTYGGGVGLVACSDIVLADRSATFCLSETRLGLIPAVIGPYVIAAMGVRQAQRFMMTAEPFNIASALEHDLVHELHDVGKGDVALNLILKNLLKNGPEAVKQAKAFTREYIPEIDSKKTSALIAKIRVGKEAQEGIAAFLEKRQPAWVQEAS